MKKLITLLLLFTLVGFLSGNQVVITNDYQYIITTEATYNFSNGNPSNNIKYDRTNKIQIQNNKVIANPLKYHYAFFWNEADAFIGYYKTNKGITTSGAYLGQVNTQSIPLPLNAYSFALVRYDNDYVLVNGFTIEELFIDNNLAGVDPDDFNDIPIAELNNNSLNDIFNRTILKTTTALPNGVKYYEVSSGNIVQRVKEFVAIESDLDTSVFTGYTNVDIIGITLPSDFKEFTVNNELTYFVNNRTLVNWSDSMETYQTSDIGKYANRSTSVRKFVVLLTKGTTFLQAKTLLIGTQVLYQLTTPITILSGVSINQAALDTYYQIYLNGVNATYYATDGNVSSVDRHYFASGKNLFDSSLAVTGFRVIADGTLEAFANRVTSDFILLKPSTTYIRSTLTDASVQTRAFYDINKTFISFAFDSYTTFTTPSNAYYFRFTVTTSNNINNIQIEQGSTATTFESFATPTTTLNLTFLFGVGNEPNKATMDGYYQEYEDYLEYLYVCCNIFATQTISFETIYFDDGVSTEIEKLGSILIFTLIGFTLMIFGFVSKRRIFNLLAVGAFVVLGFLLIEFVGFIIILFGLIFVNVYYTFFGEL
jgi:hypothetical protein